MLQNFNVSYSGSTCPAFGLLASCRALKTTAKLIGTSNCRCGAFPVRTGDNSEEPSAENWYAKIGKGRLEPRDSRDTPCDCGAVTPGSGSDTVCHSTHFFRNDSDQSDSLAPRLGRRPCQGTERHMVVFRAATRRLRLDQSRLVGPNCRRS